MKDSSLMADASLSRDEALDVLAAVEDGVGYAMVTRAFALVIVLQDAASILIDKLFPDLSPAEA